MALSPCSRQSSFILSDLVVYFRHSLTRCSGSIGLALNNRVLLHEYLLLARRDTMKERVPQARMAREGDRRQYRREYKRSLSLCMSSDRCMTFPFGEPVSPLSKHIFRAGHLKCPLASLPLASVLCCAFTGKSPTNGRLLRSADFTTMELSHQRGCAAESKQLLGSRGLDSGLAFGASLVILCVSLNFLTTFKRAQWNFKRRYVGYTE